jgi:hypothetical protein
MEWARAAQRGRLLNLIQQSGIFYMETDQYLLSGTMSFAVGAVGALIPNKKIRAASYFFTFCGSVGFLAPGLSLLIAAPVSYASLPVSSIFALSLRGGALAGFFVIAISLSTM